MCEFRIYKRKCTDTCIFTRFFHYKIHQNIGIWTEEVHNIFLNLYLNFFIPAFPVMLSVILLNAGSSHKKYFLTCSKMINKVHHSRRVDFFSPAHLPWFSNQYSCNINRYKNISFPLTAYVCILVHYPYEWTKQPFLLLKIVLQIHLLLLIW